LHKKGGKIKKRFGGGGKRAEGKPKKGACSRRKVKGSNWGRKRERKISRQKNQKKIVSHRGPLRAKLFWENQKEKKSFANREWERAQSREWGKRGGCFLGEEGG